MTSRLKILHFSPTHFGENSVIGGGERYAFELARAISKKEETVFLSFSTESARTSQESLKLVFMKRNPLYVLNLIKWVLWCDVLHCHQVYRLENDIAIILAKIFRKKVFISDLGGWGRYSICYHYPLLKHVDAFLLISEYSKKLWQKESNKDKVSDLHVIYGGVDVEKFAPSKAPKKSNALFVGRLVAHKGVDYLIEGIEKSIPLHVVGKPYQEKYLELLKEKASGKRIAFDHDVDDGKLVKEYQQAFVTAQTSVFKSCYGNETEVPELLGLSALESMACGTPVIVSSVASLPEIVKEGETGFVVPPNDSKAIGKKITFLKDNPEAAAKMGAQARQWVLDQFTWEKVASVTLSHYKNYLGKAA